MVHQSFEVCHLRIRNQTTHPRVYSTTAPAKCGYSMGEVTYWKDNYFLGEAGLVTWRAGSSRPGVFRW